MQGLRPGHRGTDQPDFAANPKMIMALISVYGPSGGEDHDLPTSAGTAGTGSRDRRDRGTGSDV